MNHTSSATESNTIECSRISPYLLIFMAWLSGTLMFEISVLDDLGSLATSQHPFAQTNALKIETPMVKLQAAANSIDRIDLSVATGAR